MQDEEPGQENTWRDYADTMSQMAQFSREFQSRLETTLSQSAAYSSMMRQTADAARKMTESVALDYSRTVAPAVKMIRDSQMQSVLSSIARDGWLDTFSQSEMASIVSIQQDLIAHSIASCQTETISSLTKLLVEDRIAEGYKSIADALSASVVKAPDFALLGQVDGLVLSLEKLGYSNAVPRGTKSFVRSLSAASIDCLSQSETVRVDLGNKKLLVDGEGASAGVHARAAAGVEIGVGAKTFNVLTSSTSVFEALAEADMMVLQDVCSEDPSFARDCRAGRFIWEAIDHWNAPIGPDREVYYHARLKKAGTAPYLMADMGKAPRLKVPCGRFNLPERAYYYFSDTEWGARQEVGRHGDGEEVQIARLTGRDSLRLLDLSGKGRACNYFLKYIRFPFDSPDSVIPTEYLVPNYVAQCCRHADFDGIKYYGSQTYSNYVIWDTRNVEMVDTYVVH